ncbi:MAG: hypothetical protein HN403_05815 [Rhodospirillales bacterium]|jgi:hypothetical protein|nr:hypothetical protein [Rhodospirillales bacterium]
MQALKSLVIGMGLLIVVGMVLLVYGLIQRSSDPEFSFFGLKDDPTETAEPGKPFGDITVKLAEGCRVEDMRPDDGTLFVRVGPAGSCARIIAIDLASGKTLGNVNFWTAP